MKQKGKKLEEFKEIARGFIDQVIKIGPKKDRATVVGLYGNLGAGKTTFTQEVARGLGIKERVISPTFVIMKRLKISNRLYELRKITKVRINKFENLIHIDAYRLKNEKELEKIGWGDLIGDPKNLILIEWPEMVLNILPKDHICIYLEHVSEHERGVEIHHKGHKK